MRFPGHVLSLMRRRTADALMLQSILKRAYGTTADLQELVTVEFDNEKRVGKLIMNRPPVNSLSLDMLRSVWEGLDSLEQMECRGLVLTSNLPKVFSAGVDITEMIATGEDTVREYHRSLQDLWLKLFLSPMATIALVNGHCPAGGCILSFASDYRIMVGENSTIGLNETRLGLWVPVWLKDSMQLILSPRQTELALQLGTLFTAKEALAINLIDKLVVDSREDGDAVALQQLELFLKISDNARQKSKLLVRQQIADKFLERREEYLNDIVSMFTAVESQASMKKYMEELKRKK